MIKKVDDKRAKKNKYEHQPADNTQILPHYGTLCEEPDRGECVFEDEIKEESEETSSNKVEYREKLPTDNKENKSDKIEK